MATLSTRIHASTRKALERAAAENKRTLSREIERRLRRSFDDDAKITELLGGRELFGLLQIIASSLTVVGDFAFSTRAGRLGASGEWLNDPYAFDQALQAVVAVLEAVRPPGDPSPPDIGVVMKAHGKEAPAGKRAQAFNKVLSSLGAQASIHFLQDAADAEAMPPSPSGRTSGRERLARQIASNLGPLHGRLKRKEPAK